MLHLSTNNLVIHNVVATFLGVYRFQNVVATILQHCHDVELLAGLLPVTSGWYGLFTCDIWVIWLIYLWHLCDMAYLPVTPGWYGLFTCDTWVIWLIYLWHLGDMAYLPVTPGWYGLFTCDTWVIWLIYLWHLGDMAYLPVTPGWYGLFTCDAWVIWLSVLHDDLPPDQLSSFIEEVDIITERLPQWFSHTWKQQVAYINDITMQ